MLKHFESDFTSKVNTLASVIATCNVNECVALNEIIRARYGMLEAEAAAKLKLGEIVSFYELKRKHYYKTSGRLTLIGPRCKLITSAGKTWTVPAYMLVKES